MSSSFVEYREKGFWSFDAYLEDTLYVLAHGIDEDSPAWMLEAKGHWAIQASAGFMGCIAINLDAFLTTEERRLSILSVATSALQRDDFAEIPAG